jgi:hypothetical protein
MTPYVVVHLLVGIALICASIGLSIKVVVTGGKVQTWSPFVWSALIGVLVIPSSAIGLRDIGDLKLVLACVGAALTVGCLLTSMLLTMSMRPVKTWTPLVWGTILGLLLL